MGLRQALGTSPSITVSSPGPGSGRVGEEPYRFPGGGAEAGAVPAFAQLSDGYDQAGGIPGDLDPGGLRLRFRQRGAAADRAEPGGTLLPGAWREGGGLVGPSGVGKTDLAIVLGYAATQGGVKTRFLTAQDLLLILLNAHRQGSLKEAMHRTVNA